MSQAPAKCLTSKAAQTALNDYLCTHPVLHDEIKSWTRVVHELKDNQQNDNADVEDDADVPSSAVIQVALGLDVAEKSTEIDTVLHCIDSTEWGLEDSLVTASEDEDIWAYINFNACM